MIGSSADIFDEICQNSLRGRQESVVVMSEYGAELVRCGDIEDELLSGMIAENVLEPMSGVPVQKGVRGNYHIYQCQDEETGTVVYEIVRRIGWKDLSDTIIFAPLALLMGFLIGLYPVLLIVSDLVSKPLHTLRVAMENFKQGDFSQKVEVMTQDEVGEASACFNRMVDDIRELIDKNYVLAIRERESELDTLQAQINPHFLYNTLEIIKAQANIQGNVTVSDALFDLGSMYRMLVKLGDTITLRQEIELLSHYLNILELGNQENFYYEIDVDEEMMELATVKFWMQPLAENYFVHGYGKEREYNLFSVQGQKKEDGYQLLIMDNGSGMEAEEMEKLNLELSRQTGIPRNKIGIRNVCQRLRYFYRNRMTFQMAQNVPRGLRIEIFIEKDWDEG